MARCNCSFLFSLLVFTLITILTVDAGYYSKKSYSKKSYSKKSYSKKSYSKKSGSWWSNPSPTRAPTPSTPSPSSPPTEECDLTNVWLDRDDPSITGDWELYWKFDEPVCPGGVAPTVCFCYSIKFFYLFQFYVLIIN